MKLKPDYFLLSFIVFALLFFNGCKKEKTAQINNGGNSVQQFTNYPFGIGREWHYNTTLTVYLNDTTVNNYVKVYKHLSDTIINGITCHKVGIRNDSIVNHNYTEYAYYSNMSDGLHIIAYIGSSGGFTWLRHKTKDKIKTKIYVPGLELTQVDSANVLVNPLHLTKLPIVFHQPWYSNEYGPQFNNRRQWVSTSVVNITLGSFNCMKLQYLTGVGNPANYHVYQHFGNKGLIKVEMRQDSLLTGGGDVGYLISTSELSYVNF